MGAKRGKILTKDEIIKLAVEAGLIRAGDGWTEPHRWGLAEIERFARAIEAAHGIKGGT